MSGSFACYHKEEWDRLIAPGGTLQKLGLCEVPRFEVKLIQTDDGVEIAVPRQELALFARAAVRKGFRTENEEDRRFLGALMAEEAP